LLFNSKIYNSVFISTQKKNVTYEFYIYVSVLLMNMQEEKAVVILSCFESIQMLAELNV
jgi:hypothetical protein